MKLYRVKVNGKTYHVELESIEEIEKSVEVETKEVVVKKEKSSEDAISVFAPIQGQVLDVLVKVGQKVKKGDVLLLIEAMKLENEVNAPEDGEVVEVLTDKGQSVTANQLLVRMK